MRTSKQMARGQQLMWHGAESFARRAWMLLFAGLWVAGACASSVAAGEATSPEIERASAEPAQVRVQGDTVYYTDNCSKTSAEAFEARRGVSLAEELGRYELNSTRFRQDLRPLSADECLALLK